MDRVPAYDRNRKECLTDFFARQADRVAADLAKASKPRRRARQAATQHKDGEWWLSSRGCEPSQIKLETAPKRIGTDWDACTDED